MYRKPVKSWAKTHDDGARGGIETAHPGYLGYQDTFYIGNLKGVGRIYQRTFVDTDSKVAQCKPYVSKTHSRIIFPQHVFQAVSHHMDNTKLNVGLRIHTVYRVRKAFQTIHAGNQDVLNPPVLQFSQLCI